MRKAARWYPELAGGKALPAELLEQILAKTDGVPLFVEELTKSILESGELKEAGDRYDYVGAAHTITIPATLQRFADGAAGPVHAGQGDRADRRGHRAGVQLRADRGGGPDEPRPNSTTRWQRLTDSGLAFRRGTPPEATYTFKHALVQDAAYDSLLKSRRQELHAKIARVIEERFPNVKDTEPEVLAHHYTAAGQLSAAIPLWQKAGELALKRMALTEAISHLNQGLELVATLPRSSRARCQRTGAAHPPWNSVAGAQRLGSPGGLDQPSPGACAWRSRSSATTRCCPYSVGLWIYVQCQGRDRRVPPRGRRKCSTRPRRRGDSDLLIVGTRGCHGSCYFWLGELIKAREHGDKVLALYDGEKHRHLVDIINHDPKTLVGAFASIVDLDAGLPGPGRAAQR